MNMRRRMNIGVTPRRPVGGAVLFEVVLALGIFVAVVAVVASALSASMDGVERQKFNLHAVNLAVSVVSELQMGARSAEMPGPEPFTAPFQDWTWELGLTPVETETGEAGGLTRVEVVVRQTNAAGVFRLAHVLNLGKAKRSPSAPGAGGTSPGS
jgi:type II secretory pathway pseudopilin PulG